MKQKLLQRKRENPPLFSITPLSNIPAADIIRLPFTHKTAKREQSIVYPSPSQPALVSCKIFSRPEFAPCLEFILKTDPKAFTGTSPMELMLSVPINFLLMKHLLVVHFFLPFPSAAVSEICKGFNPLSSLPRPRLSFSLPPAQLGSKKVPVCVRSQGTADSPGNHLSPG